MVPSKSSRNADETSPVTPAAAVGRSRRDERRRGDLGQRGTNGRLENDVRGRDGRPGAAHAMHHATQQERGQQGSGIDDEAKIVETSQTAGSRRSDLEEVKLGGRTARGGLGGDQADGERLAVHPVAPNLDPSRIIDEEVGGVGVALADQAKKIVGPSKPRRSHVRSDGRPVLDVVEVIPVAGAQGWPLTNSVAELQDAGVIEDDYKPGELEVQGR